MTSENLLENEVSEDNIPSSIENDNSKEQFNTSLLPHDASASVISNNIDLLTTNDSNVIESSSIGK